MREWNEPGRVEWPGLRIPEGVGNYVKGHKAPGRLLQVRDWGFYSEIKMETLCCLMRGVEAKSKFMFIIHIFP